MRRFAVGASAASALMVLATLSIGSFTGAFAISHVTCKKLTGTVATNITITTCSPLSSTNKSATAPTSSLASGGGTLKWSPSGKTTIFKGTVTSPSKSGCAVGSTEHDLTGTVTGGTSTYTRKGDVVKGRACLSPTGAISLVPGTSILL
jgi:hypothetical protein